MRRRLRHCRAIGLSVGLVLAAACSGMQASPPAAQASTASPAAPLVLFVMPDPRPDEYALLMLRGDESRVGGTRLAMYDQGKPMGNVEVVERIEGSKEACVEPDRVRLGGAVVPDSAAHAMVFFDRQGAQREWALLTIDANGTDASANIRHTLLALLERKTQGDWQQLLVDAGSGCDDCESQPIIHRLRAFGDFDQDGRIACCWKTPVTKTCPTTFSRIRTQVAGRGRHWSAGVVAEAKARCRLAGRIMSRSFALR